MNAPTHIHTSTHPWTPAQDDELRRLARTNLAMTEIAARLSRTPEQAFARAHELGLIKKRTN